MSAARPRTGALRRAARAVAASHSSCSGSSSSPPAPRSSPRTPTTTRAATRSRPACGSAASTSAGRPPPPAPGGRMGRGDVGGLTPAPARRRIVAQAVLPRRRTLTVHAHGHTFTLPARRTRVTADVDGVLDRALTDSRRGWLGQRVPAALSKRHVDGSLSLPIHYAPGVVAKLTARVADAVRRSPVDASVSPSGSGLSIHRSHSGRALNASAHKHKLPAALTSARRPSTITATTHKVSPNVSSAQLASKYPAYIIVDRKSHVLRFYQHLKPSSTYPIAGGMQRLET